MSDFQPVMCEGCTAEEHWRCGMQTWCQCDCDGSPDWGVYDPENEAGAQLRSGPASANENKLTQCESALGEGHA
jgi:hypothetical protein